MKKEKNLDSSKDSCLGSSSISANCVLQFSKKAPHPAHSIVYIEQIDFSRVIANLVEKYHWSLTEANETCRYYRNFLFLMVKYPEKILIPSQRVYEFWQHHVLATQQYFKDCQEIFGYYLHYYPYLNLAECHDLFEQTRELYWHEFGEVLSA